MQNIEINTTQNVSIQYQLAQWWERGIAFVIDFIVMVVAYYVIIMFAAFGGATSEYVFVIIAVPLFLFYSLLFEIFNNGRSIGKLALGIKVVKIDGKQPTLREYFLRWSFRIIDIYFSAGLIASLLISSSRNAQRLGDTLANTTVIKLNPSISLDLPGLLKMHSKRSTEVTYPQVMRLSEEQVMLIDRVIKAYTKNPNRAHSDAVNMVLGKVKEKLDLPNKPPNKIKFLKTLINDFVILTR